MTLSPCPLSHKGRGGAIHSPSPLGGGRGEGMGAARNTRSLTLKARMIRSLTLAARIGRGREAPARYPFSPWWDTGRGDGGCPEHPLVDTRGSYRAIRSLTLAACIGRSAR